MTSTLLAEDPTRIGDYEVRARLGQGGQGTVYLGRANDGTDVAIKVLAGTVAADARLRARFAREAEAARKVARFCTAAVLDTAVTADPPYIVSEYISGPSLKEAVHAEGPRTGAALERLAIATATALVAIHQAGVVHRDLKPANVILGPDGPRVIDFGIARAHDLTMTHGQSLMGTPAYMAPEQVHGKEPTPAVDIFAWACVIAYATTGTSPFHGDTVPSIMHRVLTETPSLDGVEEPLRSILASCLSKEPEGRPTATQLLSRLLGGEDAEATTAVPVTQMMATGYDAATGQIPAVAAAGGLPTRQDDSTGRDSADGPTGEPATALLATQGTAAGDQQATAMIPSQAVGDDQATAMMEQQAADPATQLLDSTAAAGAPGTQPAVMGAPQAGGGPTGVLPPAPPAPAPPAEQPGTRRGVVPWLAGAAVAVVAIGLVGWLLLGDSEEPAEPRQPVDEVASTPETGEEPVQDEPEEAVQQDQPVQEVPAETGGQAPDPYAPGGTDPVDEWNQHDDGDGDPGGNDGGDPPPPPPNGDPPNPEPQQGGEE